MQEETRAILVQKISDIDALIAKAQNEVDANKAAVDRVTAMYNTANNKLSALQDLRFKLQSDLNENSDGLEVVSAEVQSKVSDIIKG